MSGIALTTPSNRTIPLLDDCLNNTDGMIKGLHEAYTNASQLDTEKLAHLVESIKRYGLLKPMLVDGEQRLLDGRSRLLACLLAGITIEEKHIKVVEQAFAAIQDGDFNKSTDEVRRRSQLATEASVNASKAIAKHCEEGLDKSRAGAETVCKSEIGSLVAKAATSPIADCFSVTSRSADNPVEAVPSSGEKPSDTKNLEQTHLEVSQEEHDGKPVVDHKCGKAVAQPKAAQCKKKNSQKMLYKDDLMRIVQRRDKIRVSIADSGRVLLFSHNNVDNSVLLWRTEDCWNTMWLWTNFVKEWATKQEAIEDAINFVHEIRQGN